MRCARVYIFMYNQSNEHRSTNNKPPRFGRLQYDDEQVKRSSHSHHTNKQHDELYDDDDKTTKLLGNSNGTKRNVQQTSRKIEGEERQRDEQ